MEYMFVLFKWRVGCGGQLDVCLVLWQRLQGGQGLHHTSDNKAESADDFSV